ncbi:hypothetical protein [Aquisalimonas sp.]|uniref:hypothetical protein n=1 Tax=Aquisalimonas sp. TaxID=1872621 RepID=UPI0025BAD5C7|nr:hypothetical protein [Aquisalimonas sp.]
MFRNKETVALNDILVQCESNAKHLHYTVDLLEREEDRALLKQLADERVDFAEQLRRRIMQGGELADTADTELDTLQELGETLASNLAAWGRQELLQARIEDEEKLIATVDEALTFAMPPDYGPLLEHIRGQAKTGVAGLRGRRCADRAPNRR